VTYMTYTKTELDGFYRRMRAPARPQPEVVDEFSPAVVHELTERPIQRTGGDKWLGLPPEPVARPEDQAGWRVGRSVSVVCRLCHGDLDEDGYCPLDGEVTLR
jgi:hypothetical protein